MGNWKIAIVIIVLNISVQLVHAVCPDSFCAARLKLEAALLNSGHDPEYIAERLNALEVKARIRQAKYGLEYEQMNPQWPEDPRYPVPYLFYRQGQPDFGFGRW